MAVSFYFTSPELPFKGTAGQIQDLKNKHITEVHDKRYQLSEE
jgi:hypothetical protein